MARTFVTPNFSDLTQGILDDCIQTSFDSLRRTTSGTDKVVLKYEGTDPNWVASLGLTKFTQAEIQTETNKAEWNGASDD